MFNRQPLSALDQMKLSSASSSSSLKSSGLWMKESGNYQPAPAETNTFSRYTISQYPSNGFAGSDLPKPYNQQPPRQTLGRADQNTFQDGCLKQADLVSQYSTNLTANRDQVVETRQSTSHKENTYTSQIYSYQGAPLTPTRNRSPSPIGFNMARSQVLTKSPTPSRYSATPKSPMASPMRASYSMSRTSIIPLTPIVLEQCPLLEAYGLYVDNVKTERAVNAELTKMAKDLFEMAKLLKNSVALLKRDLPGSCSLATQMISKNDFYKNEVTEAKKRLSELHAVVM